MDSSISDKFEFLLGDWKLEYYIPKSQFSDACTEIGQGTFKMILNDRYVQFEYTTESGGAAKGIFAWDDKINAFRYWWFENSGNFSIATCNFINETTLAMNWHETLLVQTFTKETDERVVLKMQYPDGNSGYELVMKVNMHRI
ncbi:MAG: hypothetical protein JXR31_08725 [Prolixibacteraceae bacterium]|nr:hypothetical protein [Prolixibacteraceae bacterium]MBN2774318.1 hypothetical protein [Prolixibacteraceae bacterium]